MNLYFLTFPIILLINHACHTSTSQKMKNVIPKSIQGELKVKVTERFINYVSINTQSDEKSNEVPSTKGQTTLAELILKELYELKLSDISIEKGYIYASIESNIDKKVPVIGFLSHFDTSPDVSGENVNPKFIENYNGEDIYLDSLKKYILTTKDYPFLTQYKGKTLITTDGNTLLGADDKSGLAEIITAIEYLKNNPQIKHGKIVICFTPDEEIGRGTDHIDSAKFKPDFAYTMDGEGLGTIEYENFNAATAQIKVKGINFHPGYAKDKMKNSMSIAFEINQQLPMNEKPENTENYEGYFHLCLMTGTVEETNMEYLIRDHDRNKFNKKKENLKRICDSINSKYGDSTALLTITDSYYNMKEKIEPVFFIIELAKKSMQEIGITPLIKPIRGGTDGSRLSFMGIPCPNLFAGGHNFHSRYECISVESMLAATQLIIKIAENNAK